MSRAAGEQIEQLRFSDQETNDLTRANSDCMCYPGVVGVPAIDDGVKPLCTQGFQPSFADAICRQVFQRMKSACSTKMVASG